MVAAARWLAVVLSAAALAGLVAAGAVSFVAAQPDRSDAVALVSAGLADQQAERLADAAQAYRQAIAHDPRNDFAWFDLGTVDQRAGRAVFAADDYRAALDIDGSFVPALFNLAILESASFPLDAVALYQHAIQLAPTDADLYLNLGFLDLRLDRIDDAKREFARAVQLEPTLAGRIPSQYLATPP